jgi:hypothetical protein
MTKLKIAFLVILILTNIMVLLGQIWPEGVPPFAKTVNISFLCLTLVYFILLLAKNKR